MSSASMITKKDSNGKVTGYVVRWRNPAGMLPRQPKRTFKKSQKQLAERFLATVSFRLSAGEAGLAIESPLSLKEFYEQTFLPRREKETDAKTNEGRASFWGKWIEPNLGGIRIGQVKPIQVLNLEQKILNESKFETAQRVRALLNAIYSAAKAAQVVERNPVVDLPAIKKPRVEKQWLSKEEVRSIISATDDYSRPIVVALALTGLRLGELAALQVEDIDLDENVLFVTASMSSVSTKHRPGQRTKRKATKTQAGKRKIAIPETLTEVLRPLVEGRTAKSPVFTSPTGCRIDVSHFRSRVWKRLVKRAGAPEWATPRDLRHHVASVLFELGVNDVKIAKYLGHKNTLVTRRVYVHFLSEDTREVADALSGADLVAGVIDPTPTAAS
jgi:integrase